MAKDDDSQVCWACGGSGVIEEEVGDGEYVETECSCCGGSGRC